AERPRQRHGAGPGEPPRIARAPCRAQGALPRLAARRLGALARRAARLRRLGCHRRRLPAAAPALSAAAAPAPLVALAAVAALLLLAALAPVLAAVDVELLLVVPGLRLHLDRLVEAVHQV